MKKLFKAFTAITALALLSLGFTACGGGSDGGEESSPSSSNFTVTYISAYGTAPSKISVAPNTALTDAQLPVLPTFEYRDESDGKLYSCIFVKWFINGDSAKAAVSAGYKVTKNIVLEAEWNKEPANTATVWPFTSSTATFSPVNGIPVGKDSNVSAFIDADDDTLPAPGYLGKGMYLLSGVAAEFRNGLGYTAYANDTVPSDSSKLAAGTLLPALRIDSVKGPFTVTIVTATNFTNGRTLNVYIGSDKDTLFTESNCVATNKTGSATEGAKTLTADYTGTDTVYIGFGTAASTDSKVYTSVQSITVTTEEKIQETRTFKNIVDAPEASIFTATACVSSAQNDGKIEICITDPSVLQYKAGINGAKTDVDSTELTLPKGTYYFRYKPTETDCASKWSEGITVAEYINTDLPKADTPVASEFTVTHCTTAEAKGSVTASDSSVSYEYKNEADEWTALPAAGLTEVEAGTVLIRRAADSEHQPSDTLTLNVKAFRAAPAAGIFTETLAADDSSSGSISGITAAMAYTIDGGAETAGTGAAVSVPAGSVISVWYAETDTTIKSAATAITMHANKNVCETGASDIAVFTTKQEIAKWNYLTATSSIAYNSTAGDITASETGESTNGNKSNLKASNSALTLKETGAKAITVVVQGDVATAEKPTSYDLKIGDKTYHVPYSKTVKSEIQKNTFNLPSAGETSITLSGGSGANIYICYIVLHTETKEIPATAISFKDAPSTISSTGSIKIDYVLTPSWATTKPVWTATGSLTVDAEGNISGTSGSGTVTATIAEGVSATTDEITVVSFNSSTADVTNDTETLGLKATGSAVSSDTKIATAVLSDEKITITSVGQGKAVITVTDGTNQATIDAVVSAEGTITATVNKYYDSDYTVAGGVLTLNANQASLVLSTTNVTAEVKNGWMTSTATNTGSKNCTISGKAETVYNLKSGKVITFKVKNVAEIDLYAYLKNADNVLTVKIGSNDAVTFAGKTASSAETKGTFVTGTTGEVTITVSGPSASKDVFPTAIVLKKTVSE